jgi:hypothetical protein
MFRVLGHCSNDKIRRRKTLFELGFWYNNKHKLLGAFKSVIYGLKSAKIRQKYQVKCLTLLLNMPYILFIERCPDDIILNMLCVIIGSLPAAVITLVISRLYYLSTLI